MTGLLVALVALFVATVPVTPASAGCAMPQDALEDVVCGTGYGTVQGIQCKVLGKFTGCLT